MSGPLCSFLRRGIIKTVSQPCEEAIESDCKVYQTGRKTPIPHPPKLRSQVSRLGEPYLECFEMATYLDVTCYTLVANAESVGAAVFKLQPFGDLSDKRDRSTACPMATHLGRGIAYAAMHGMCSSVYRPLPGHAFDHNKELRPRTVVG